MSYNEELDDKICQIVSAWGTTRRKMFGGTCHLLNGNMMCGVYKDFLILRVGEAEAAQAMRDPTVREFDISGRPMKGWVMVDREGQHDNLLRTWLERARTFTIGLPPK